MLFLQFLGEQTTEGHDALIDGGATHLLCPKFRHHGALQPQVEFSPGARSLVGAQWQLAGVASLQQETAPPFTI